MNPKFTLEVSAKETWEISNRDYNSVYKHIENIKHNNSKSYHLVLKKYKDTLVEPSVDALTRLLVNQWLDEERVEPEVGHAGPIAFVICPVRMADELQKKQLEVYTQALENEGYLVHLPHRDTNQTNTGYEICKENMEAIKRADEVHIFYREESKGSHFDMGVAFALEKKIVIAELQQPVRPGKSFGRMLIEWFAKSC